MYTMQRKERKSFFGTITDIESYGQAVCITVRFHATSRGGAISWAYYPEELSLASELNSFTLEEIQNKYKVIISAEYR